MMTNDHLAYVRNALAEAEVAVDDIQERSFPGERWVIVIVPTNGLLVAQSLAGAIERGLNAIDHGNESPFTIVFRAPAEDAETSVDSTRRGRLSSAKFDQLIQLLEARSRTSDALPSLKYVEDPRASLAAVAASRHQVIYGRRGVGKTALLLEAKRLAESQGNVTVWMNAHVFRNLDAPTSFLHIAKAALTALAKHGGSSQAEAFGRVKETSENITSLLAEMRVTGQDVGRLLADLNGVLRGILRQGLVRLNIYVDDFYLFPIMAQPQLLDYVFAMLRDCDGWLKLASIERLTRPFEPSSKIGIEIPHDASKIDLDVTLEDPISAQSFLENVLSNYTAAAGVGKPSRIAKSEALGRLVLASGGVPRDYLNLFASSIVVARQSRAQAQQVGREDVAVAAGRAARGKKRDLELDVASQTASSLLSALDSLSTAVKRYGFTYFRVDVAQKYQDGYEALAQLVDLRFVHLIQAALSDQHKGGTRYEAYILDLSEYTDVRLKRGLEVLDLEDGQWSWRLAGKARTERKLTGTQLRDRLRLSPLVNVEELI
jgi:hypothetical protein